MRESAWQKTAAAIIGTGSTVAEKFATTLYLPALPAMAIAFSLDRGMAQQAVPLMLIGIALSQFVWGRVSDQLGQRRVLFILIPIYVSGAAFSALAKSFPIFMAGLFLQGFAIGAIFSVSQALVGSVVGKSGTARILALIALLASWSSAIGATIGGFLVNQYGWQMPFVFLGLFILCVGGLFFLIPSASPKTKPAHLDIQSFLSSYASLLLDTTYRKYALVVAWLNAGLFVFLAQSSFVVIHDWKVSAHDYGLLMFIPFSGIAFGRFACTLLDGRMPPDRMILLGGSVSLAGGAVMLVLQELGWLDAWTLMGSMALYLIGLGLSAPNGRAKAMHAVAGLIGSGASLLSVIVNLLGSITSSLAGHLPDTTLGLFVFGAAAINMVLFLKNREIPAKT